MNGHEMLDLVPLYALDALEGREQRDLEAHLGLCDECIGSLAEYQTVATSLVHDEPASAETWESISAAITTEGSPSTVVRLQKSTSSTMWRWVAGVAAAAVVVLGALMMFDEATGPLDDDSIVAAARQVAGEEGSFVGDFLVDDVAVAQIVLADNGRGFVIPTEELPALDSARTYQLWVVNDAEDVISAGVLGSSPAPATFTWTGEVTGFALTREVSGGVVSSAGDVVSAISATG
jgi:anti-sigma-K factor RskA